MSPGEFVALAETTALVTPMTRWVIDAATRQAAIWAAEGLDISVAINVSPKNLEEPDFVEYLLFCCTMRRIDRARMEIEVTEGVQAARGGLIPDRLAALRKLGFSIAIDDFGSGYSNMSYLTRLSAHTLKIDQSLVRGVEEGTLGGRLVSNIVQMGRDLGYRVVAEGIETDGERALLTGLGLRLRPGLALRPADAGGEVRGVVRRRGLRHRGCRGDGTDSGKASARGATQGGARRAPPRCLGGKSRSALGELEAPARLALAVLLALDDAAVAGQEARGLQRRAQARLVERQRLADAVLDRAGLAGETAALDGGHHVELAGDAGDGEGLADHHLEHRAGEVDVHLLAVDDDLAVARLDPDAGDRVLALAGRVGAAEVVANGLPLRGLLDGGDRRRGAARG